MHGNGFRTLPSFAIIVCAILIATPNTTGQQTEPCRVGSPKQLSFSAEIKIHSVQTLADGTTITRDDKGLVARDSQGRTLNVTTSQPFAPEISEESAITFATVDDPVAGTQTRWHSRSRKATVLKMPSERYGCWTNGSGASWNFGPRIPQVSAARSPCESKSNRSVGGGQMTRPDASAPPPNASGAPPRTMNHDISRQDLGTEVILGVEAHGSRRVITTPAGAVGNDKPLVRTMETWIAPGLITPLRQITTDMRTGNETREVVRLDLTEPPLSVFQPPEAYEIQLEEMHEVPCQQ